MAAVLSMGSARGEYSSKPRERRDAGTGARGTGGTRRAWRYFRWDKSREKVMPYERLFSARDKSRKSRAKVSVKETFLPHFTRLFTAQRKV